MGVTKKLSQFIVDWEIENGTSNNGAIEWEYALTLHSCISVMHRLKINELNMSIATGPLYVCTESEAV